MPGRRSNADVRQAVAVVAQMAAAGRLSGLDEPTPNVAAGDEGSASRASVTPCTCVIEKTFDLNTTDDELLTDLGASPVFDSA